MNYEYYYNNVPGSGPSRNNLIYTSLISTDKKTFVQWYHNDVTYHKNQNQVVDAAKMEEKWLREVNYLTQMRNKYPELVPIIKNIDLEKKKLFLSSKDFRKYKNENFYEEYYLYNIPKYEIVRLCKLQF